MRSVGSGTGHRSRINYAVKLMGGGSRKGALRTPCNLAGSRSRSGRSSSSNKVTRFFLFRFSHPLYLFLVDCYIVGVAAQERRNRQQQSHSSRGQPTPSSAPCERSKHSRRGPRRIASCESSAYPRHAQVGTSNRPPGLGGIGLLPSWSRSAFIPR